MDVSRWRELNEAMGRYKRASDADFESIAKDVMETTLATHGNVGSALTLERTWRNERATVWEELSTNDWLEEEDEDYDYEDWQKLS